MTDKDKLLSKFGKQLISIRESKNLSIRELALRANLEYSQVQRIEKGKVNLAFTTLIALADGLDISPTELLNFKFAK